MISHLRLQTTNPNYQGPASHPAKTPLIRDRTSSMQNMLRSAAFHHSQRSRNANMLPNTGALPCHFQGRGHLEGSCVAFNEGLLENKEQKKRRRAHRASVHEKKGEMPEDIYGAEYDDDSSEDEEEKKVWKPVMPDEKKDGGTGPVSLETEIKSLNKEGLDWKRSSKYGKKSRKNFDEWLTELAKQKHREQMETEDHLFE